ncbi:MAG: NAD-dependent epimerase/dehydratase family protein [Nannocystaceae bacterium]
MSDPGNIRTPLLIVGTGFLGSRIQKKLEEIGVSEVVPTTRSGVWDARNGTAPPAVTQLDVITDPQDRLQAVVAGVRSMVICYAPGSTQARRELYVQGTTRILRAADTLTRVVYVSSTSALPDGDAWVDESCDKWPEGDRGHTQREAEEQVRSICERGAISWTVLRLAGLYGPGRDLRAIYGPRSNRTLAGDGWQHTNLIHVQDAVTSIVAALGLPREHSARFHICDDDHRTRRELFAEAAKLAGRVPPSWESVPPPGSPPRGKRVCNRRMKRELGVVLQHPTHDASTTE